MTDDENTTTGRTKGETDGSFGDGKAGAASGVGFKLSTSKDKQVKGEHRHLMDNELIEAFVEFFSETLVASANIVVNFVDKASSKGFAIVNWAVDAGKKMAADLAKNRTRTAGPQQRKPGADLNLSPGPAGPTTR